MVDYSIAQLADALKPYIVRWIPDSSTSAGAETGSIHDISGPLHNGTLALSQAPWALPVDGSRSITGNILVDSGITIDGVDISAHAANANAHHNQSHVLATTSGLGADHTVSGLTAGQYLRASSASAAVFSAILDGDLPATIVRTSRTLTAGSGLTGGGDLSADRTFNVAVENTIQSGAGAGLSVEADAVRLTASYNPGAAAAVLATNSSGQTTIPLLVASTSVTAPQIGSASGDFSVLAAADITLNPTGGKISLGSGDLIKSSGTFTSGFAGSGWQIDDGVLTPGAKTATFDDLIIRGRMNIYELLVQQIRATNGSIIVSAAGKLESATLISGSSYDCYVEGTSSDYAPFAVGDLLRAQRLRLGTSTVVWRSDLTVTAVSVGGNTRRFTATLRATTTVPAAGMEFVRIGNSSDVNRQGSLYLTADDSGAPFMDIVNGITAHTDWNTAGKVKGRFGRLDGVTGNTNEYGIWAGTGTGDSDSQIVGSTTEVALKNVPLRFKSGSSVVMELAPGSSAPYMALGATLPTGPLTNNGVWFGKDGANYKWRVGTVSGGSLTKGIFWDGADLIWKATNTSLDASGNLVAGPVTLSSTGVTSAATNDYANNAAYKFTSSGIVTSGVFAYATPTDTAIALTTNVWGGSLLIQDTNRNAYTKVGAYSISTKDATATFEAEARDALGATVEVARIIANANGAQSLLSLSADIIQLSGSVEGHLLTSVASTYDIGTSGTPWRKIYVGEIVASTITGSVALAGNTWQRADAGDMYIKSSTDAVSRTLYVSNPGAGSMHLDVEGNITLTGTVDGVDIAAHAADTNAHHARSHAITSTSDHTASGLTTGHVLRASGATTFAWAQLAHSDLSGVSADQHHAQSHVLATNLALGADHTISGATSGHVLRATGATTAAFQAIADADLPSTIVRTSRQVIAGNGLITGGALSSDVTLTLGTPSSLTASSTNAVTTTSHTHAIDATIARSAITITAGSGLTGGGDLTASRTLTVGAGLGITVNADDVALTTPGTLAVATTNSSSGSHTHAITSSSNPGAAASLLATNGSGHLQLAQLGIGAAAVTAVLDVANTSNALRLRAGNTSLAFSSNQILFSYGGSTQYTHAIKSRHNAGGSYHNALDFYLWNQGVDTADTIGTKHAMTIEGTGRVGIGTTSPGTTLDVVGSGKFTGSVDVDVQFLGQAADTISAPSYSWTSDTNTGMYRPATDTIGFTTNGAERMRINATGNVGLGTTDVEAWGGGYRAVQFGSHGAIMYGEALSWFGTMGNAYYDGAWKYRAAGVASALVMDTVGATIRTAASGSENGALTWVNAVTVLSSNGYVGINDATPSYRLEVNGDIGLTGTLFANGGIVDFGTDYFQEGASYLDLKGAKPLQLDQTVQANGGGWSITKAGAATFASDMAVGSTVFTVNVAGTRVGINRVPDAQFSLDIAGAMRADWLVGSVAIQLPSASAVMHFDGPGPDRLDYSGTTHTHLGVEAAIAGGGIFRPGKFGKAIQTAPATTNLMQYGSFEVDTDANGRADGWSTETGASATLSRVTGLYGSYAQRVDYVSANAGSDLYRSEVLTANTTYTVSFWYRCSGTSRYRLYNYTTAANILAETTLTESAVEWRRQTYTFTTAASPAGNHTVGFLFYLNSGWFEIDGVQVEAKSFATPYCDGSLGAGHTWSGTAFASNSVRDGALVEYPIRLIDASKGTIMMWVRLDSYNSNGGVLWRAGDANGEFDAYVSGSGALALRVNGSTVLSSSSFGTETWRHVAWTWDAAANQCKMFVDGVALGTVPAYSAQTLHASIFNIGSSTSIGSNYSHSGLIDDVVVLDYAADPVLIRSIYESDAPVFVESSVQFFRSPSPAPIWVDEFGLWAKSASGNAILGVYAGDPQRVAASRSWGGLSLEDNDILIGRSTNGYVHWDDSAQTLNVAGTITAQAGSITGALTLGSSGGIYQGSGTFASPTTGLKIWNDSGTGRIGGYNSGTLQWYAGTDGKLYATGGQIGGWTLGSNSLTGTNIALGSTGYITVGSGNSVIKMDPSSPSELFWVGHANYTSAPFRISPQGDMFINGATFLEVASTPTSTLTQDTMAQIYLKGDKLIIRFDNGGTARYKYLDLTGTGVTWVHTTTAP